LAQDKSVLLVCDDEGSRDLISRTLLGAGYVITAASLNDDLEGNFCMVVLDLPDDGIHNHNALARIRRIAPHAPIIIINGSQGAEALYSALSSKVSEDVPATASLQDAERVHIKRVLHYTNWNRSAAAVVLGIDRKTLSNRIKEFKLRQP